MPEIRDKLLLRPDRVMTAWGDIAWPCANIPPIMEIARGNNWVVLGGDVLTAPDTFAYTNWYYEAVPIFLCRKMLP